MSDQIREFLKMNKPEPMTEEERATIMKISKKSIWVFLFFVVILLIIGFKDGFDAFLFKFGGGLLMFIGAVLIVLEVKDKVRYKSYDKIFSTYVYVESGFYVNKAYHINVCYYDHDYGMFNKTKMNIDGIDVKGQNIGAGAVINILVGEKKSKLHYIAMK